MRLEDLIDQIDSVDSFLAFVEALRDDCEEDARLQSASEWWGGEVEEESEDATIPTFLDAMLSWARDGADLAPEPNWRDFARLLLAGRVRE